MIRDISFLRSLPYGISHENNLTIGLKDPSHANSLADAVFEFVKLDLFRISEDNTLFSCSLIRCEFMITDI